MPRPSALSAGSFYMHLTHFIRPLSLAVVFACSVLSLPHVPAAEVAARGYTFRVPEGFSVRPVAEPPLVKYPICADFDERGRLYVCESSGTADWNKPQPKETQHRVTRLEDSDGDG